MGSIADEQGRHRTGQRFGLEQKGRRRTHFLVLHGNALDPFEFDSSRLSIFSFACLEEDGWDG